MITILAKMVTSSCLVDGADAPGKRRGEAAAAAPQRPYNPRSFMDVLREWEEFEKEFESSLHDTEREAERALRQEKKVRIWAGEEWVVGGVEGQKKWASAFSTM